MTRLREPLFELAASGRPLVVDLDQVGFIDLAGLAALVGTAKRAAARGGSLHVACARPQIRRLFRLTGLDRQVPLARTMDEALEALVRPGSHPASRPLRARTAAPGPGGRDRKAMRSGEEASPPGPQAAPAHRVGHAMGSCGLLAMVPESVTVKHHASRAGHGPGAGGHKGESGRCRCCGSATAAVAGTPRAPTA